MKLIIEKPVILDIEFAGIMPYSENLTKKIVILNLLTDRNLWS